MADITPLELANIYARFFVEDFATDVMRHLDGSYPIDADVLKASLQEAITKEVEKTPLTVASTNAIGRFLYECAAYAIDQNIPEKTERSGWDHVRSLPSQHHQEIQSVVYQSAYQYLHTVNKTLLGVVGRDAALAHNKIKTLTDERLRSSDTGGTIREFNWGILSDGQWLNAALMRTYDLTSTFRPGDNIIPSYVSICLDFAYQYATVVDSEAAYETSGRAELHVLAAQSDEENAIDLETVADSVFRPGYLRQTMDVVARGQSDVKELIWATERLSGLANVLTTLIATARAMDDDTIIAPIVVEALVRTYNAVTVGLSSIEALRETKFAQSLILLVTGDSNDPALTVTVNGDQMRAFTQSGGTDNDLILFGHYLDPRKGVSLPSTGWSLDSVLEKRDAVVPEMMAEEADRTERLRSNDAAFIDRTAVGVVRDVVESYLKASNRPLYPVLEQQIDRFGRDVSNPNADDSVGTESLSPDACIAQILVSAIGDPFLEQVRGNLFTYVQSNPDHAPHLTVMRTAVQDAMHFITMKEEPEVVE